MRVAIVGSRRHPNMNQIMKYVKSLPKDTIIVTGDAYGVDEWTLNAAEEAELTVIVHMPDYSNWNTLTYHEMCQRYYERNERIVKDADKIVAFVMSDRKGGTENTIKWAEKHGKPVEIIYPESETT